LAAKIQNLIPGAGKRPGGGVPLDDAAATYLLDVSRQICAVFRMNCGKASVYILPKTHITLEAVQELTPFHSHVFVLADK